MFSYTNLKNLFFVKYAFILSLPVLVFLSLTTDSLAAKGNFDRSFGNGGKVITPENGAEKAFDSAVLPDGKIIVVGASAADGVDWNVMVRRYNADGSKDLTFNNSGKIVYAISQRSEVIYSVKIQTDGKILLAGYAQSPDGEANFIVMRLLANGIIDQFFGNGGWYIIGPTATDDIAMAVDIQNVGGTDKIVVAGTAGSTNSKFCLARLEMNGQFDSAFGIKLISLGGLQDILQDMTIDSQNRIVATGSSRFDFGGGSYRDDFAAIRLLPDGTLDASFSGDGKVITQMGGNAQPRALAVQTVNGAEKIVLGGFARVGGSDDFALLRYNADGNVDATFGTNGKTFTNIANDEQIQKLLVQPDSKIIGVGLTYAGANRNFALARYTANGSLDKTFGACGKVNSDLGSNTDSAYGAALQTDGKIIAVGESTNPTTNADFALARYTNGGQATAASADFDGDGKEDVSVYRPSEGVWYENCTCQGFRAVRFGLANDIPVYGDYDGDGITDQAVYRGGTWYVKRSSDNQMSVVNFGLETDIPTVGDYDGDEKADVSVWRPDSGVWYILRSSDLQYEATVFGQTGDKPVPADYDADGKTDFAIYRGNGEWWIKKSSDNSGNFIFQHFGIETDTALTGDFDGDGRADLNIFRASEGNWYQQSSTAIRISHFGIATDKPAPADYDGDGKSDIAVFRSGQWHILSSSTNAYSVVNFGLDGDLPTVVR